MLRHLVVETIRTLLVSLPNSLAWCVGFYLAIKHREQYPAVSLRVAVACGIFLFLGTFGRVQPLWLPTLLCKWGLNLTQTAWYMTVAMLLLSTVGAIGWLLLLTAIFSDRN